MSAAISARVPSFFRDFADARPMRDHVCDGRATRDAVTMLRPVDCEAERIPQIRTSLVRRMAEADVEPLTPAEEKLVYDDIETALRALQEAKGVPRRRYRRTQSRPDRKPACVA